MTDAAPALSIVLPAYNEAENLPEAVAQIRSALDAAGLDWELIAVDDGSADATGAIADRLGAEDARVRAVRHDMNRGKGAALRTGFAAARAPVVGYTDADLPFDMEALGRAYTRLVETGADMVAGYRTNRERYSLRRRIYSGTYNALVRALLGLPLDDVGFALKVMRREVFEAADLHSDGGFADVELIARAYRAGARIERVGVAFTPRVRGTSTMAGPASVAGIVRDMVRFRLGRLGAPRRTA
ncbi:MAG: glycosyltransferase family 2 protein [Bacteroidota bacterium]